MATEVGVAAFQLAVTERSIVRELPPRRLERLRTIAREAAEQSERGIVPEIAGAGAARPGHDQRVRAALRAARWAAARAKSRRRPAIVIGPEGGFTPAEVQAAIDAGVTVAGLGPRILRSETVAAVAAAVILSRTGDFA